MRLTALALVLAACGGGAPATSTITQAPTTPGATDEDWRGTLNQLSGPTCKWIDGSSFLACSSQLLLGWEPHNRRYVLWWIADDATVQVHPGTVGGGEWTFGPFVLRKQAENAWGLTGPDFDLQISVNAGAPPAALAAAAPIADWRNPLQRFTGEWTVDGTAQGTTFQARETCNWITGATFVVCKVANENKSSTLIGYEPHNARFVQYLVEEDGNAKVLVGTQQGKTWTFAGANDRITMTQESGIKTSYRHERGGTTLIEAVYTTKVD